MTVNLDLTRADWRTSSRSGGSGQCVEVATNLVDTAGETVVLVRDSKNPNAGTLAFTPGEWQAFVSSAKDGEFDL